MSEQLPVSNSRLEKARFRDSLKMEYIMLDLFGKKYYGMAGMFDNPAFCRKCMLRVVKRIRKRMNEVLSMDERLRQRTNTILENLESHAKQISMKENVDWLIIADLLDLVVHLLGYDWQDGKVHRQVFFFQEKWQEQHDKQMENSQKFYENLRKDEKLRYMLVQFLITRQLPKHQIARLLGISLSRVNNIVSNIVVYENENRKPFPGLFEEP